MDTPVVSLKRSGGYVLMMGMETLEHLQSELCKRYGVPVTFPARHLKVGVSADFFSGKLPLNGLRHPPEPTTSGWFLWAGQEFSSAPDFFQPMHVEHLFERCQPVLPYLALPPGWRFLLADNYEDVWQDDSLLVL